MSWSSRIYWWRAPLSRTGWGPLTSIGNPNAASADFTLSQWRSEAKFVAVRVGQVKEPLAPFGIARCGVWSVAGRDDARIEAIDIGMVEDDTPPPRPISFSGLCDEIEKAGSSPKTCKRGFIATMNDLKSQHAIEGDGARHIVGGQRDGTDALHHRPTAPFFVRVARGRRFVKRTDASYRSWHSCSFSRWLRWPVVAVPVMTSVSIPRACKSRAGRRSGARMRRSESCRR